MKALAKLAVRLLIYGSLGVASILLYQYINEQAQKFDAEEAELEKNNKAIRREIRNKVGDYRANINIENDTVYLHVRSFGPPTKEQVSFSIEIKNGIRFVRFVRIFPYYCPLESVGSCQNRCQSLAYSLTDLGIEDLNTTQFIFSVKNLDLGDDCAQLEKIEI